MKIFFLVAALLILCPLILPQSTMVPVNNEVYDYLDRLSIKNVIYYSKLILPKTRTEIAEYLVEIEAHKNQLTEVEKEELEWYKKEYIYTDENRRFDAYFYSDSVFTLSLNPVIGVSVRKDYDNLTKYYGGIAVWGSLGNWGFQMDFRDHTEQGNYIDRNKNFGPETGIQIIGGSENSIEYSEVKGAITYSNKYVTLSAGKEWFNWGSGYRGKLILSQKAPSFPFIRFDIRPVSWLNFYYIHGWLNSRVRDSVASYDTPYFRDSLFQQRIIEREKFYAAHVLEIIPVKGLNISVGESVVYSDQGPKFGFLIPFLFFRLVDHYYEGEKGFGKGSNSQLFADINTNLIPNLNLYSTLFIDELSLKGLLSGESDRNHIGYTIGAAIYDLEIPNLTIRCEYTKILPWVYSNFIQTQTYASSNYLLGHYIGQNSDQVFTSITYRILRGLKIVLWGEYIRNGGISDIKNQYELPGESFLYGLRRNELNWSIESGYEILHDFSVNAFYKYSNISDNDKFRTPVWQLGVRHSFGISANYGM